MLTDLLQAQRTALSQMRSAAAAGLPAPAAAALAGQQAALVEDLERTLAAVHAAPLGQPLDVGSELQRIAAARADMQVRWGGSVGGPGWGLLGPFWGRCGFGRAGADV